MKKQLAILLSLLLLLAALPTLSASAADEVTVSIDGEAYTAHVGDTLHYTCYLDLSGIELGEGCKPNRITELEGAVFFQENGLRLLTPIEDDEGFPPLPHFSGNVMVSYNPGDALRYNAVSIGGYLFKQKKVLIDLDFEITDSSDLYIINHIENLGSGDVKLIYCGEIRIMPKLTVGAYGECPHIRPATPPRYTLTDEATGVTVAADENVGLVVKEIPPYSLDRVLSGSDHRIYEISLIKDGAPYIPAKPVIVTVPAETGTDSVLSLSKTGDMTRLLAQRSADRSALTFLSASLGRFLITAENPVATYLRGDVDSDGDIVIIDASLIQCRLAHLKELTPQQLLIADFNRDGCTDIHDVTAIQRMIAGLDYQVYN